MDAQDMVVETPVKLELLSCRHVWAGDFYCDCPPKDVTVWVRAWAMLDKDSQTYRLADIVVTDDSLDYGLEWDSLDDNQKSAAEDALVKSYEEKLSKEGRAHE